MHIKPLHIVSIAIKLFFVAMGLYFLFGPHVLDKVPHYTQQIFGGLLIGYGSFRAWMAWRSIQSVDKNVSDEE